MIVVFALTFAAMRGPLTPGAGVPTGSQPEIQVIGHQWWWEIRYPQAGVVTANVLHLPVGRPVLVTLEASGVQHDFWVPELGQKMDMYPGKVNYIWLEANAPGQYQGACAEFCGVQHAWMRILAVAQPPAEFDAWLAAQRAAPAASAAPLAQRGQTIFAVAELRQLPRHRRHAVERPGRAEPEPLWQPADNLSRRPGEHAREPGPLPARSPGDQAGHQHAQLPPERRRHRRPGRVPGEPEMSELGC